MRTVLVLLAAVIAGTMPAGAQKASDYEQSCQVDSAACQYSLSHFRKYFPLALSGDIQARRNIAACFSDGCDGAILRNQVTACAWRIVIVGSGSPKTNEFDISDMKKNCEKLDDIERQSAVAQAARLLAK